MSVPAVVLRTTFRIAICAAPVMVASCFSSANAPHDRVAAKQLASWDPIPGRTCRTRPATALPAAPDLIDVGLLNDSLATPRFDGLRGRIVFSLVYTSNGLHHSEVIQTSFNDTTRAAITRVVDSVVRKDIAMPDARFPNWGWQLGIDVGEQITLEVGHQELCFPILRSASPAWEQAGGITQSAGQPGFTDRDRVLVRIRVDERGRAEGEVIRPSMTGRFDRVVPSIIASQAYWPMLVDRIPVPWEFEDRFP